jgi:hypothetical protein
MFATLVWRPRSFQNVENLVFWAQKAETGSKTAAL